MPIALQTQVPSQTDYAVRMFPYSSSTQVTGSPFSLSEAAGAPGLYLADTADTDIHGDGRYRLEFIKGGQPFSPPLYDFYELKGGSEASIGNLSIPTSSAIATAVDDELSTQLNAIELNSKIASEPITNRTAIDSTANTYTLYQDDGTTPRVVKNLTDENGSPNASRVFEEVPQ